MVKLCFHVSSISHFLCCVFVSSFFVKTLVCQPFPRPDQIEILLAFKNEFPILKCDFRKWSDSKQKTKSWTSKDVKSFDGVVFDNDTGVVTKLDLLGACLSGTLRANSSLFRFHHLRGDLSYMGLAGEISSSFSSLNRLTHLTLCGNELIGSFSPLFNLSRLSFLSLFDNHFSGNIHCSLLTMPFLSSLDLSHNHLTDSLEIMNCSSSSKLQLLDLSNNRLSGRILKPISKLTNLKELHLTSQNTTDPINFVSLGFNSISRLDIGSTNLITLGLTNCSINEFPTFIKNLQKLHVFVHGKQHAERRSVIDLAHNNFSGSVPRCLINSTVEYLDLRNNNLIGKLPDIFDTRSSLIRILDVSHNQIAGKLPMSLTNCTNLEVINVESNRIVDLFPFWLKDLPKLKVVVLRSNMFHGPIYSHQHPLSFPQLRMVDISRNKFTGRLPHDYFVTWSTPHESMIGTPREAREPLYIGDDYSYRKDSRIYYNDFTGHIPSSWANLTRLESLDLSGNQLSGKIPHELASLSFLEYINVSHNKLSGQIPQSTQLGGQPKSSFEGNLNLCGLPLQESCFRYHTPSAPEEHHLKPPKREQVLNWKAVAMGYGPGVLFGLVIGQVLYSYKPVLFYKLFRL
ncbi:hypothetical protein HID58_045698 [Brassica napus]|uniref:Uncharacterized protein n=2 Tax=Brassica napus TaxID=3708 RepID=A0ABQ8AUA6_BRANA|nr:hypothetical protein HID58_045698 [Brassica napus]